MNHQQIDLETIKEFMKETLSKVERSALSKVAGELELKHLNFKNTLSQENISLLKEEDLLDLFTQIFALKRKKNKILELYDLSDWKSGIQELLYGNESIENRFEKFCQDFDQIDRNVRFDLASELLHFSHPNKYWLWCRWLWDEKLKTGALPLVVTENFDLEGKTYGESYMRIGKGIAFVHSVAEIAGFKDIHSSLFGTDVFLSCVYIIYAYTILRMRMTQEFNKVMPSLIEFSRRLLGVYHLKAAA